jgi:hypothetical protein
LTAAFHLLQEARLPGNPHCLCGSDKAAEIHLRRFVAECQWVFFGFHRYFTVFTGFCAFKGAKHTENPTFWADRTRKTSLRRMRDFTSAQLLRFAREGPCSYLTVFNYF